MAPTYVQGNFADPKATTAAVTVAYMAEQRAGNLNVVIVGWNDDATVQVSSVTDSNGNAYQLAGRPTVLGGSISLSQAIYYAKNVAAGANSVRVRFNGGAANPDIRIMEYSGLDTENPLDVAVGETRNSATSTSGTIGPPIPTICWWAPITCGRLPSEPVQGTLSGFLLGGTTTSWKTG